MAKKTKKKVAKKKAPVQLSKECKTACVVKRAGHEEMYDERKVYASCYYACKATHLKTHECEDICSKVVKDVNTWVAKCACVDADQIHPKVAAVLKNYNKEAAFLYDTHRDIS